MNSIATFVLVNHFAVYDFQRIFLKFLTFHSNQQICACALKCMPHSVPGRIVVGSEHLQDNDNVVAYIGSGSAIAGSGSGDYMGPDSGSGSGGFLDRGGGVLVGSGNGDHRCSGSGIYLERKGNIGNDGFDGSGNGYGYSIDGDSGV